MLFTRNLGSFTTTYVLILLSVAQNATAAPNDQTQITTYLNQLQVKITSPLKSEGYGIIHGQGTRLNEVLDITCGVVRDTPENESLMIYNSIANKVNQINNPYVPQVKGQFKLNDGRQCYLTTARCDTTIEKYATNPAIPKPADAKANIEKQFQQAIVYLQNQGWGYTSYNPEEICVNIDANGKSANILIKDLRQAIPVNNGKNPAKELNELQIKLINSAWVTKPSKI
ncbi:hypothetical protein BDF19DRAFT_434200 [Syncephalis fuscata]|nr:hypothetical protein BDF19DRAFT_434200 [Syncephalis fuscata]